MSKESTKKKLSYPKMSPTGIEGLISVKDWKDRTKSSPLFCWQFSLYGEEQAVIRSELRDILAKSKTFEEFHKKASDHLDNIRFRPDKPTLYTIEKKREPLTKEERMRVIADKFSDWLRKTKDGEEYLLKALK